MASSPGVPPVACLAPVSVLLRYLQTLLNTGLAGSTVKLYVAAISFTLSLSA